jgi:hypothetical protein
MPQYIFFVWNKRSRVRYPRSFELPDLEAAREVALRIARVFREAVPGWDEVSYDRQNDFAVQIDNEVDQTVLTVPFAEACEPRSCRTRAIMC